MDQKYIIGVDIGGTWIRVAICKQDLKEENIKIKVVSTPKENKFSISNSVCTLISELLKENNTSEVNSSRTSARNDTSTSAHVRRGVSYAKENNKLINKRNIY